MGMNLHQLFANTFPPTLLFYSPPTTFFSLHDLIFFCSDSQTVLEDVLVYNVQQKVKDGNTKVNKIIYNIFGSLKSGFASSSAPPICESSTPFNQRCHFHWSSDSAAKTQLRRKTKLCPHQSQGKKGSNAKKKKKERRRIEERS